MPTTKQTTAPKANTDDSKALRNDLAEFRISAESWNEEFDIKLPSNIGIIKGKDNTDKNGNIKSYGKLMLRIKFEGQRKGFFISSEEIADNLINCIVDNKDLILALSQQIDIVNETKSNGAAKKGKAKEYKIL